MPRNILIVDDNAELRELLRLNFKAAGFSITTAASGNAALRKARALVPDLILLDLELPEVNGFAVCEILRRDPATASIPIIMLTGLTSQFSRIVGLEVGADDYVTKPASPQHLLSRVKALLRRTPVRSRARDQVKTARHSGATSPRGHRR
jgi:DNA-binding response OmpR family regulator